MRNIVYVVLLTVVFSSCQKEVKIGYVNNSTVINDYQEKKDLEAKFKIREDAYRQKFDSIDKAFQLEVQKFQLDANKMPQAKAEAMYQELGQKKQLLDQQKQMEAQQFQQSFQTKIDTLIVKVKKYVKDYGKNNGYTYVLGTSDAASTVLYGTDENDLTKTILDGLNAEYKKQ